MKVIWAPWRMELIKRKKEKGCVFCTCLRRRSDRSHLILYRGKWNFVILNRYPYVNGHLMVLPNRHIALPDQLKREEATELLYMMGQVLKVLQKELRAEGFNIGLNLGRVAGASVPGHLHFHLVPRWMGDTNFWPVLSGTKSIPEELMKTYDRLKKSWRPS